MKPINGGNGNEKPESHWGCHHCPQRFVTLTQAWRHKRDVHGIDPFKIAG